MGDRWDGLRGDLDLVRSMEHERVSMSTDEASALLAERDALAAEVERLREMVAAQDLIVDALRGDCAELARNGGYCNSTSSAYRSEQRRNSETRLKELRTQPHVERLAAEGFYLATPEDVAALTEEDETDD